MPAVNANTTVYSASELYSSAVRAGFSPQSAPIITAISLARGGTMPFQGTNIHTLDQSMQGAYTFSHQGTEFTSWPEVQSGSVQKYLVQAHGASTTDTATPTTPPPITPTAQPNIPIEVASGNVGYTDPSNIQGPILSSAPTVTSTSQQASGIGTLLSGLTGTGSGTTTTASTGLASWFNAGRIIKLVIGLLLLGGALLLLLAPMGSKVAVVAAKAAPEAML